MKKIALMSIIACLGLFAVSCKNQPKEEPATPQEAVEQTIDAAVEVSQDAAATVKDALEQAGEAVQDAVETVKEK